MSAAANGQTQQLRQRISFDPNVPVTVTLDGLGTEQPSRDGTPEYRYFLQPGAIMWVPAEVHQAIQRHSGNTGSQFEITKSKRGNKITWSVVCIEDQPAAGYGQASPTRQANPQPAATRCAECGYVHAPGQGHHTTEERTSQGWTNREAPTQTGPPIPTYGQAPAARPLPETGSQAYYTALCAAIRCAAAAEKFAQEIGRPVAFDSADVRTMAATLYIQGAK